MQPSSPLSPPSLTILLTLLTLISLSTPKSLQPTTKMNILWRQQQTNLSSDGQQIQVCPDQSVMKAKYECFIYSKEQVEDTLGVGYEDLIGMYNVSECRKIRSQRYLPGRDMPSPNGGFRNVKYQCLVRGKK